MNSESPALCLAALTAASAAAFAQETHGGAGLIRSQLVSGFYGIVSGYAVVPPPRRCAEENYSFKPTPDAEVSGQLVGHVADCFQYFFCSTATGDANPMKSHRENEDREGRSGGGAAGGRAVYGRKAYAGMTDAQGSQAVKFMAASRWPSFTVLSVTTAHTDEHYGNMVTYLAQLKGIVPPSSEMPPSLGTEVRSART